MTFNPGTRATMSVKYVAASKSARDNCKLNDEKSRNDFGEAVFSVKISEM